MYMYRCMHTEGINFESSAANGTFGKERGVNNNNQSHPTPINQSVNQSIDQSIRPSCDGRALRGSPMRERRGGSAHPQTHRVYTVLPTPTYSIHTTHLEVQATQEHTHTPPTLKCSPIREKRRQRRSCTR